MSLGAAARWLFPRTYGDGYSAADLEQLKAWESFRTLNIGRRENPPMPSGDVTPRECPRAKLQGEVPEIFSGRPTLTARAAGTTSQSQASSTETASADRKLTQRPVVDLPRVEMPPSSSPQGRSQRTRTSTPTERAPPQVAANVPMDVDSQEIPSTFQGQCAGGVVRPKEPRVSNSHAQAQPSGQRKRGDQKAKQRATDQQGVHAMVAGVLERQGVEPEDWENSQRIDYRVDPLLPPTWVVRRPPGQHMDTLEGVPEEEWRAEPDITPGELFRRLTQIARGTSQACSYRSQEMYFGMMQTFKETMKGYENQQGIQYNENAVHMDREIVGPVLATFAHLQRKLQEASEAQQLARDREVNANIQRREAEKREAQLKCNLKAVQDELFKTQQASREHERLYHETLVRLKKAQSADPASANAEDQVRIQTLEAQLDDALQRLERSRAEQDPGCNQRADSWPFI